MPINQFLYAKPGETFPDQPYFKWTDEHKFIMQSNTAPDAPALLVNTIGSWLSDRGERAVAWRKPRGETYNLILASVKSADTALLLKLTFGGAI
jgi:hypothetical protein